MADQGVELTGPVPDGWISVDPRVVNEDAASIVLLRTANLDDPFTANITVSERIIGPGDDLAALAATYRQGLTGRTMNLVLERESWMSSSAPRQYAQELHFTVNLNGHDIGIKQSQFLLEVPTEEPPKTVLLQVLYSAPVELYDSAKSAVVEFMETLKAQRAQQYSSRMPNDSPQVSGVGKHDLEARVKELLEHSAGAKADAVICNGDLRAEVGAVQRCALVVGQDKLGVTVTVLRVDRGNVNFDIQVDNKPMV